MQQRPTDARPLSTWWHTLQKETETEPLNDPIEPVITVTDDTITVINAGHNALVLALLALTLGSWLITYIPYDLYWPNLPSFEEYTNRFIELRKNRYGDDYFEVTDNPVALSIYNQVDENGKTSWKRYFQSKIEDYGAGIVILEMIYIAIPLLTALYFTFRLIFFPRQAKLCFDRKRGIVYGWLNNRVYACRFENLGFVESRSGIQLFLYGESPKQQGQYSVANIYLQPTSRNFFNSYNENRDFMALILAFMKQGKQAVITGEQFHRKYPFLRIAKKPHDFDTRLEEVLKREHVLTEIYAENAKKQR